MADTDSLHRKARTRRRAIGLGVAIAVHVAVLAALVLTIAAPLLIEPPPMLVSLTPAFPAPANPRPRPAPRRVKRALAPRAGKQIGPAQIPALPIPAAPPDAAVRERLAAAPFTASEPVREGLRTSGGCADADFLKLSPAERDKCRQRNHDLGQGAPTYAVGPYDAGKRAYLDKQAAKNNKRRLQLEAPPVSPMVPCANDRFSNLGFSCPR